MKGQLSKVKNSPSKQENMEKQVCGSITWSHKRKAAALWTKHKEGGQRQGSKHRGTLSGSRATRSNKWHIKRHTNREVVLI